MISNSTERALLILALLSAADAGAAACCSAGAAAPALISGDEAGQVSISASAGSVIGDAPAEGLAVFRSASEGERTQTMEVAAAWLLSDRWQAGLSLPFVRREIVHGSRSASAAGMSEARATLGFEVLPEWEYSVWKPRGFVFAQVAAPFARSIYNAREPWAVDAFGTGFWKVSAGTLLLKRWSNWDVLAMPELHYSFAREFQSDLADPMKVRPSWGGSIKVGAGRSWSAFHVGASLMPAYQQPRTTVESGIEFRSSRQLVWTSGVDLAYAPNDDWSVAAAYADQTLLGPAVNSTLSRSFAIHVRRTWSR